MRDTTGVIHRILAFIIDFIFLSLFFFPATYSYSGKWLMTPEDHLWRIFDPICLAFLIIIFLYFIMTEAYLGWTVGKWVMRIRVVDLNGGKIGLRKSVIRNLLRLVDGLPFLSLLGLLLIIFTRLHQRLGDIVAGTLVVKMGKDSSV